MKKIVFLVGYEGIKTQFVTEKSISYAAEHGYQLTMQAVSTVDDVVPDPEAYALMTSWSSPKCCAAMLDKMPNVKIIGHAAGSVRQVIEPEVYERNIRVVSANYIMSHAVAEWSLLMNLLASRRFFVSSNYPGGPVMDWDKKFDMLETGNLTIGCWGLGDTTRHFLKMLQPLAPGRILVASNHSTPEEIRALGAEKADFDTLIAESDIFHCLVGVNDQTFHRIGAAELSAMKPGSTLINGGRSGLIQPDPLFEALQSKHINAILDVFEQEPLPADSRLYTLDNVIMTPHNAGYPGRSRFVPFLIDEFCRFEAGEKLMCEVDARRYQTQTVEHMKKK